MAGKGRTIWWVRAMPFFTSAAESRPVMSLPRNVIRPAEGVQAPVITLNSVVLPAPLGPMKPQMCCWGTSKLTSRNAATPPKYLVRVFTSRIFTPSPEHPSQQSHQAVGFEQNNKDQQGTV